MMSSERQPKPKPQLQRMNSIQSLFPKPKQVEKTKCYKVWTSYGIGMHLLSFMWPSEQTQMQACNQFCYKILVSRVQTRVKLPWTYYLTSSKNNKVGLALTRTLLNNDRAQLKWQRCEIDHDQPAIMDEKHEGDVASIQIGHSEIIQINSVAGTCQILSSF